MRLRPLFLSKLIVWLQALHIETAELQVRPLRLGHQWGDLLDGLRTLTAVDHKMRVQEIVNEMSQGRIGPLFDAMAEDVTWRWSQWSRTFEGKQVVVQAVWGSDRDARPVVQYSGALHPR